MSDHKVITRIGVVVLCLCVLMRGWDAIVSVVGTLLVAAAPLLAGAVIAYIVNILMTLLERHLLPNSDAPAVVALRPPLCMAASFLLIVAFVVATASLLVPAFVESFDMIGERAREIIAWLKGYEPVQPLIKTIDGLFSIDTLKSLSELKIPSFLKQGLSNMMGPLSEQLAMVATSMATLFFGLLFSTSLLLDRQRVARQVRRTLVAYLGVARYERIAHVCAVLDRSYHGYIVRQCAEAVMLGTVSAIILLLMGFPYALGISALVVFAALIPVVGIPVGVCVGAFLVFTDTLLHGVVYLVAMFVAQGLVETFVMPHVGDRRILLSPVWTMAAVTLGGGMWGFLGMVSVTPLAAAVSQLLREGVERREAAGHPPSA